MGNRVRRKLNYWMEVLGLDAYEGRISLINPMQVTDEDDNVGATLVGGIIEDNAACIITTRRLSEEDIVHELLHFVRTDVGHEQIVEETKELIIARNLNFAGGLARER